MAKKKASQQAKEAPRDIFKKSGNGFFEDVYAVVRQIPAGRVTSYGAIAACLGSRLSARMVGWAMNAAHQVSPPVPAHRVVNRNGQLSGKAHFGAPDEMQRRLEMESIRVENDQVVDFARVFWDPSEILL